jgi:hypothetical protein
LANFLDAPGVETEAGAPARQVQTCKLRGRRVGGGEREKGEKGMRRIQSAAMEENDVLSLFYPSLSLYSLLLPCQRARRVKRHGGDHVVEKKKKERA